MANEVRLQSASVFLPIKEHPGAELKRHRRATRHAGHLDRPALSRVEVKALEVRPGQRGGIGTRVRDDMIQDDARRSARRAELDFKDG